MVLTSKMTSAFIDSSVFIAAVRSPTGGSGEVLRYAIVGLFEAVISEDVVEEVERYFHAKGPALLPAMKLMFSLVPFHYANPTVDDVMQAAIYTPSKDKAIVAGANVGKVDYLVTLDKKHLLDMSTEIEQNVRFKIIRPEGLLDALRRSN
jgi:predicted nucleic acid-binding protein